MSRIRYGFLVVTIGVPVLIAVLMPLMLPVVDPWVEGRESVCDFTAGGGSRNLCENRKLESALLVSLGLAVVLVIALTWFWPRKMSWKHIALGVAYLVLLIPANLLLYESVVGGLGLWGDERGAFNDYFLPVILVTNLVVYGWVAVRWRNRD